MSPTHNSDLLVASLSNGALGPSGDASPRVPPPAPTEPHHLATGLSLIHQRPLVAWQLRMLCLRPKCLSSHLESSHSSSPAPPQEAQCHSTPTSGGLSHFFLHLQPKSDIIFHAWLH
ncbi:hypothetical protein Q7C36_018065 [Tachysurus vachellii]|uniref:Uncharacterized protein n=1 Tax=Tachysurus vachellii TaxID=175792 RepID=A0AA88LZ36_TACVA|nr:hypothetical protein Q7C36_018065 [Tachysurus vachellii]